MNTKDFYYDLDPSYIAQHPEQKRENSKLMIVNKNNFDLEHKRFYDIIDYLEAGDCLVLNDTKVIPARIYGHRPARDEKIEVLLLKNIEKNIWECLVKPGKKMKLDTQIIFSDKLSARVVDITEEGHRYMDFSFDGVFQEILEDIGSMPIPPYITEKLKDKSSYQTVYAKHDGSVAAPTAGLHFSKDLLERIEKKGVDIAYVTLHVGYGTFKPVTADKIEDHIMHSEYYIVNKLASDKINKAKKLGKRVIAVGTTSVRTLESVMTKHQEIKPCADSTNIFIYPGYEFKIVDAMITNFHLPESTLIMLVSTFASKEIIMNAYEEAKKNDYKFFSFGDAMLIR
ncbi:MAG: tRNA preQ1(34) S-adenosylmethionine ribosyltransferase-isomerase QueA [Tissierellia bacterium]|nr:tRNA preQ1(34) S-adenosylmethionine ribosyltransferase-isomerase QueA [Tissierellia bacterium]